MFRKKDSQHNLFQSRNLVPPAKQRRLQATWAESFRAHALPLIQGALSHSRRPRGHGLGTETKTRSGLPVCARTLARGAGRLPESPGLQYQVNGAGAYAPTRSLEPGDGLKRGTEVPFGAEKKALETGSGFCDDSAQRPPHGSPSPIRFTGRKLKFWVQISGRRIRVYTRESKFTPPLVRREGFPLYDALRERVGAEFQTSDARWRKFLKADPSWNCRPSNWHLI